ncbi:MAG TPA: Lrp/AsnC ligand binding domain-containing protein [Selenomonadales bacterium]|nr:Lrp/AsnC ligand binding domain-containing protein [Selenomonadales bacterium]
MLTDFDKRLLNVIQKEIPLAARPFAVVAERLNSDEAYVLERLRWLRSQGFIRRMGPFFDSARLGYSGTLVAVEVEPASLAEVAERINLYPGVTHNYEREGPYNLWFALLSPNAEALDRILREVALLPGVRRLVNLPAQRKFKVNVQFTLE